MCARKECRIRMYGMDLHSASCFEGCKEMEDRFWEIHEKLHKLNERTFLPITCTRSQRLVGPQDGKIEPESVTELFIANIPQQVIEDELYDFLSKAGTIWQIRLMITASGLYNRTYAFVKYCSKAQANIAVQMFVDKCLPNYPSRPIVILRSRNNKTLFLGGIPIYKTRQEIANALIQEGILWVKNIIVHRNASVHFNAHNRGYAFLEFDTHQIAAANRNVFSRQLTLFGKKVFIDWSKPELEIDPTLVPQITKLFLRYLPLELPQQKLYSFLRDYITQDIVIDKVYKRHDYAFVHFLSNADAARAKQILSNYLLPSHIQVKWAIPPTQDFLRPRRPIAYHNTPDNSDLVLPYVPHYVGYVSTEWFRSQKCLSELSKAMRNYSESVMGSGIQAKLTDYNANQNIGTTNTLDSESEVFSEESEFTVGPNSLLNFMGL